MMHLQFSWQVTDSCRCPVFFPVWLFAQRKMNCTMISLKEENMSFPTSEVDSSCRNFTKTEVDCLWCVDPMPGDNGHYKAFKDLLGTKTDGTHQPSLQKASKRTKTLPFSASVQHVKNADTMLQCDECGMWRLLYCRFKLSKKEQANLQTALQDVSFTCGAQLQNLELPGRLNEVYTRKISCEQPMEKL